MYVSILSSQDSQMTSVVIAVTMQHVLLWQGSMDGAVAESHAKMHSKPRADMQAIHVPQNQPRGGTAS